MGEFPEPAIQGSPVAESIFAPATSTSASASASASEPIQSISSSPSTESLSQSETKTSVPPISTLVTSNLETSSSLVPSTVEPDTTELSTTVETWTSAPVTKLPPFISIAKSDSAAKPTSSLQATSAQTPQSTFVQIITPASAPAPSSTISRHTSVSSNVVTGASVSSETSSTTQVITRPIITPTFTQPPPLANTTPTANSHLSLGAIVGIVITIVIALAITGVCIILGPRRALRKIGINANRGEERIDYEEWEHTHRGSGRWTGRPASIGVNSDWWKSSTGALPTRPSTVTLGGPGIAGIGAGRGTGIDNSPASPAPRRVSQRRTEERGAVRSGWFATSMVRGASLLSLGSLVRPPVESTNSRGSERMSRMGTGGSAGKRFQELYRRERASGSSNPTKPSEPTEYLATINEMGQRQPSGIGQRRVPGEMSNYRPRSAAAKVRRPSRLASSYVPDIVVQDTTLPNLSSLSSVTHESSGRGYDADAEVERYPRVI